MKYSSVVIIYNPNSTRDARGRAARLAADLRTAAPKLRVRMRASKRRGHASSIAYRSALLARHALIVSVSGDGGYNDVVNGALRAQARGKRVTVGLIPAGNANDHFASVHRGDFVARVLAGDEDRLDVLRLRARSGGRAIERYGHSYIGLGLTPQAGEKLNAAHLTKFRTRLWHETRIVIGVLLHPTSIKILVDGEVRHYDSLIFSNIGRMSKVIRVPKYGSSSDGLFEVSHLYRRNKFKLVSALSRAALFGLPTEERAAEFSFETLRPLAVQIDGEIIRCDAGARAVIDIAPGLLRSIV